MVDVINLFLAVFSGVSQAFTSLEIGGYSVGSMLYGGFVIGLAIFFVLSVIRR